MAGTGHKICGTGANVAGLGEDWVNPTNVQSFADTAATVALAAGESTDNLRCTNFDFSQLASTDTIIGITVLIMIGLSVGADSDGGLTLLQLTLAGSVIGDDQISGTQNLVAAHTALMFGGSSNLMGATPSITNAQTNTFGVEIIGTRVANDPTISIRHVRMAIHTANTRNRRQISARGRMR